MLWDASQAYGLHRKKHYLSLSDRDHPQPTTVSTGLLKMLSLPLVEQDSPILLALLPLLWQGQTTQEDLRFPLEGESQSYNSINLCLPSLQVHMAG